MAPHIGYDCIVYVGGAIGIDTLCLDWILSDTKAIVVVACPGRLEQQPERAQESIRAALQTPGRARLVELRLGDPLREPEYFARNRWMVDRADMVVGFPKDRDRKGGTWYTIDYGASKRLPHLIVPV